MGRGRPKKDDGEARNSVVAVRLMPEEKTLVKDAALNRRISVSDYMREALNNQLENDREEY